MKIIKLNFHYKSLIFMLIISGYLSVVAFYIVPQFRNWDYLKYIESLSTLLISCLWLIIFPLFFQFCLKMFISITQKQTQEMKFTEQGLVLPEFYIRFWSLEMGKEVLIPYENIKAIKFAEIPNPLFPQKLVSVIYNNGQKEKRLGFCDNQFSRGIVDYQMAFDFLKNKPQVEILDPHLTNK